MFFLIYSSAKITQIKRVFPESYDPKCTATFFMNHSVHTSLGVVAVHVFSRRRAVVRVHARRHRRRDEQARQVRAGHVGRTERRST